MFKRCIDRSKLFRRICRKKLWKFLINYPFEQYILIFLHKIHFCMISALFLGLQLWCRSKKYEVMIENWLKNLWRHDFANSLYEKSNFINFWSKSKLYTSKEGWFLTELIFMMKKYGLLQEILIKTEIFLFWTWSLELELVADFASFTPVCGCARPLRRS